MSFVNLMDDVRWSETDIIRRTESMRRSIFSDEAEMILNRKFSGQLAGMYSMTEEEELELTTYNAVVLDAQAAGHAARADMALKSEAMAVEAAQRQLTALPDTEENAAARAAAQAVVEGASAPALQLVDDRAAHHAALYPPEEIPEE